MKEKICGIYKITNLANGKVYIGQSVDIFTRWKSYQRIEKSIEKPNQYILRAILKYGLKNFKFEIIHQCLKEELNPLEKLYIEKYQSHNNKYGYNETLGGDFGKLSEEARKRISIGLKTSEKRKQFEQSLIGKKRTEETKKKMSESAKQSWINGRDTSNYHGGITEENRKIVCENRKRIAIKKKTGGCVVKVRPEQHYTLGFKYSDESRKKMSESAKKRLDPQKLSTTKGTITINNGTRNKHIKPEELDTYIKDGWIKGQLPQKKTYSEETRQKWRERMLGNSGGSHRKRVLCVETQEIFDSIHKACNSKKCYSNGIRSCLKDPKKTSCGFHWVQVTG